MKQKTEDLIIPTNIAVFEDKRTGAKTVALPFQLADGTNAVVMLTRLKKTAWRPELEIEKITIHFKHETSTN